MEVYDTKDSGDLNVLINKEIIYTTDEFDLLQEFLTTEEWTGPKIKRNGELKYDFPTEEDNILEKINEINEKALYPTDLKEAVVGYVERFGMEPLVLLDKTKCIDIFMKRDGMSYEDALEFFDFNVIGAWMGEGTPCFATFGNVEVNHGL